MFCFEQQTKVTENFKNDYFKGQSARSKIFVLNFTTVNRNQKITFDSKMSSLAPSVRALELNQ